ncbi:MAG: short chain dehydrogenase [Lysobacteraceae bacterium]|nr:MAG: short chain dehydrogenase [Xanthomonadaceae bacterium]
MAYFVTGATGFVGKHLVKRLLKRKGQIYCLVRAESQDKLAECVETWGSKAKKRVVAVEGDLAAPNLGLSSKQLSELKGKVKHFYHLAAIYDLAADAQVQVDINVGGTRHAVTAASAMEAGCLHHVSSIAAAGMYNGVFREDMFEEAENLQDPYFRTKHESEGVVRRESKVPFRIYRPGIVVGDSRTGEMEKIDGPYYFFKLIQKMRNILPPWMPTIGIEGGRINIVPIDFVADAMDHISHVKGEDGGCFHLTDPKPRRVGEVLNTFARAGHAPQMTMRVDARMFGFIPKSVRQGVAMLAPVRRITQQVLNDLGIPREIMKFITYPTRFDSRETERVLKGTKIKVPPLSSYAEKLWDYWERNLDPDLFIDRSLSGQVRGKVVLVTGSSSGIGRAAALMLGRAGAKVMLVARKREKLEEVLAEIEAEGGEAYVYTANIADMTHCDELIDSVIADHGQVDVLVNNAGRSIRRSVMYSFDRFHDFERTMQLNYFGSLRLIMRALPSMMERRSGHIINISSIGVLSNAPRFSAYVASKAALDAFSRCASSELLDQGINFTTINMPLVRTPMIAPTKVYQSVPTISPEEAADFIKQAIIFKPVRIATRLGVFAQVGFALMPKVWQVLLNTAYRLFSDSSAAQGGAKRGQEKASQEQIAFASLMRGIHF